jgi:predicted small lipoprotein YifL
MTQQARKGAWILLSVLLALAACGSTGPDLSTPDPECRAQAENDPSVKEAILSASPSAFNNNGTYVTTPNGSSVVRSMAQVRFEAYRRCMRARGLMPQGGVQAPSNPNSPSYRWP